MTPSYWPDLAALPAGWRLTRIEWVGDRVKVELERDHDGATVRSTGRHRTPATVFGHACAKAFGVPS